MNKELLFKGKLKELVEYGYGSGYGSSYGYGHGHGYGYGYNDGSGSGYVNGYGSGHFYYTKKSLKENFKSAGAEVIE